MLRASKVLRDFVDKEVLPGTGVSPQAFWSGLAEIAHDLAPKNAALLEKRDKLQAAIDQWFKAGGNPANKGEYQQFLQDAGYLVPEEAPFQVSSENVDPEIATLAGPQLVCPSDNARFLLNAANARWGSLLDALYGTNAMLGPPPKGPYDAKRGEQVFAQVHALLDELPRQRPVADNLVARRCRRFAPRDHAGRGQQQGGAWLREPSQSGYNEEGSSTWSLLLEKNGLHAELIFDASGTNKRSTQAGLVDVKLDRPSRRSAIWRTRHARWTPTTRWSRTATGSASGSVRSQPMCPRPTARDEALAQQPKIPHAQERRVV